MHRQHPLQVSPTASPGAGEGSRLSLSAAPLRLETDGMYPLAGHRGQRPVCTNEHWSEGRDETPGPEKQLCLGNPGRRRFPQRGQAGVGGHGGSGRAMKVKVIPQWDTRSTQNCGPLAIS